ncbi:MAG: hypothetical protein GY807_23485 [Gammaproteobacteria bacterium]|nr:hypothetical protein [Gammaproteobacteria bacterium]
MNAILKDALWRDCWMCHGASCIEHNCGDYKCHCLDPENNILCPICDGEGGWYLDDPAAIDKEIVGAKDVLADLKMVNWPSSMKKARFA